MRNTFFMILTIVIIIFAFFLSKYYNYVEEKNEILKFNLKYEEYLQKQVYGADIATVINKAINDNKIENLTKEDEKYINIEIKIIDLEEEKIFQMESFYNGGIDKFVQYYNFIQFKCTNVKYASNGKINYMLFEQITI